MGGVASKPDDLEGPARAISGCLSNHGKQIEVLSNTVRTQHGHVQVLYLSVNELVETYDTPEPSENADTTVLSSRRQDVSSKWQRHTKELLESIQNSLVCQCDILASSFEQINQHAIDIFKTMNIDLSTSSDIHKAITKQEDRLSTNTNSRIIEKLRDENDKLADENKKVNIDLAGKAKVLIEYEAENTIFKNTIKELEAKKEELEHIVKQFEENRTVFIQVFFQVKGDMMLKIMNELKGLVAKQLKVERRNLKFVVCQNKEDVDPELPLFVLCINASRLGTDVGAILQDLNVSSNVSVLVFHHKDIHALPNQTSDRVLTDPEFKDLGGILDIAFLSDKGIYDCKMNQTSASSIEAFLKRHLNQT